MLVGWLFLTLACSSPTPKTLFQPRTETGIEFSNTVIETEQFNIIEYLYFYNGAGVSIGDVNNDGLPDVYLVSNQDSNRLFLNNGNWKFEDITHRAGVPGKGNWKTGTVMADVNGDGWVDIYTCGVGAYKSFTGSNQLYINNGDLTFSEKSAEYGLAFTGFSTQACFFDYDRDGDLDMYLLNHSVHSVDSYGRASLRNKPDSLAGDRLFENLLIPTGQPTFIDVTAKANIFSSKIGYGLGIGVADVNDDQWPDIYVSNDFHENDYLYINNQDKTFTEVITASTGHTSRFSMGNDLADFNNDLRTDIVTTDMFPNEEPIIKTSAGEDSYEIYQFKLKFGYHTQAARNSLQMNQGVDARGMPCFSDIAFPAGIAATDWSWSPLLVDFDGDGWKDLYVTNGIIRRPNDLDYANFISSDSIRKKMVSDHGRVMPWLSLMPEGRVKNFFFQNQGDSTFRDASVWAGVIEKTCSTGMAVGDLDNDGDPDFIINNLNGSVGVWENKTENAFVRLTLQDTLSPNTRAVGAKVHAYVDGKPQAQEVMSARGWCSSSDFVLSFGVGKAASVDSALIFWPDGSRQIVKSLVGRRVVTKNQSSYRPSVLPPTLFSYLPTGIPYRHQENDFNAISREGLIPRTFSADGPALAIGDVNGDLLDDFYVGGAKGQPGSIWIQQEVGPFKQGIIFNADSLSEDIDAAFFDVDGDRDLDLVVVAGGQEELQASELIKPRLYVNDGKGQFSKRGDFPDIYLHASCVRPCDYDQDGDIDLFIGASVMPLLYGMAPVSYLLVNDGRGRFTLSDGWLGQSMFDNLTRVRPGMVRDARWADINNDGLNDLVLVGEWMPITVLKQQPNHTFTNATVEVGLDSTHGLWNCLYVADVDQDGDVDIVAGNMGFNSRLSATRDTPLSLYLGDFDSNGNSDHVLVYENGGKMYPFASRDQLVKQIPSLKRKFLKYADYRDVELSDVVTPQQKGNSAQLVAYTLETSFFENSGGAFSRRSLPRAAQYFPVHSIVGYDFDQDGVTDILLGGNETAVQPEIGPMDAGWGLFLKGKSNGNFQAMPPARSGLYLPGNVRASGVIRASKNTKRVIFARNNDSIAFFLLKK